MYLSLNDTIHIWNLVCWPPFLPPKRSGGMKSTCCVHSAAPGGGGPRRTVSTRGHRGERSEGGGREAFWLIIQILLRMLQRADGMWHFKRPPGQRAFELWPLNCGFFFSLPHKGREQRGRAKVAPPVPHSVVRKRSAIWSGWGASGGGGSFWSGAPCLGPGGRDATTPLRHLCRERIIVFIHVLRHLNLENNMHIHRDRCGKPRRVWKPSCLISPEPLVMRAAPPPPYLLLLWLEHKRKPRKRKKKKKRENSPQPIHITPGGWFGLLLFQSLSGCNQFSCHFE